MGIYTYLLNFSLLLDTYMCAFFYCDNAVMDTLVHKSLSASLLISLE